MRLIDYLIVTIGCLIAAVIVAVTVTMVTGSFCQTSHCSSGEPTVIEDRVYTGDSYGWPFRRKTDMPPALIKQIIHPAYEFNPDGVSYKMFWISAGANFVLAVAAELALLGGWCLLRRRVPLGVDRRGATAQTA